MTPDQPVYPPGTVVEVKFPLTPTASRGNRAEWPWLPGWIESACGPGEWQVCVQHRALAWREDGSEPGPDDLDEDLMFPLCYREKSEIRLPAGEAP